MKIAILTHPLELNYGGILQNYAMHVVLKRLGHEPITIDRHNRKKFKSFGVALLSFVKRNVLATLGKDVPTMWNPFCSDEDMKILSENMRHFVDDNITCTERIYSDDLERIDKKYLFDAYVVGSDQVWLDAYCPNSFLDFVERKNVKMIVYAASSGPNIFFKNEVKLSLCKKLVKNFVGVSVREQFLVDLCKNYMNCDAQLVLDPVLLLDCEDFLPLIHKDDVGDDFVFSFLLDESNEKNDVASFVCRCLGLESVCCKPEEKYVKGVTKNIEICKNPPVDYWLSCVKNSRFVVTDSFHCVVFSIVFRKNFLVVANKKRGVKRIESLLTLLGLENRLVDADSVCDDLVQMRVNYDLVYEKIERMRICSMDFLRRSLETP